MTVYSKEQQLAIDNLIFECMSGSHAYGTNAAHSDTDIRGIFIAPPSYNFGLQSIEQVEFKLDDLDTTYFELRKFIKLAANCNPNIIELLFTDDVNILKTTPSFKRLQENKNLFLSRKVFHTFSGYAHSQLHRIKGHNKWLVNPQPEREPSILDHAKIITVLNGSIEECTNLSDYAYERYLNNSFLIKINENTYRIYTSDKYKKPALSDDKRNICYLEEKEIVSGAMFIGTLLINKEAHAKEHKEWKAYWDWKKERNPVRSKLEEEHGFDTKHAMHLVRLLRMAKEILTTGQVIVRRPDAKELIEIRDGKYDYNGLIHWADEAQKELKQIEKQSELPFSVDLTAINKLFLSIVMDYWKQNNIDIIQ